MNYRGRRRRLQLTKLMPALQDCARRIRRREWRLIPCVRSGIIISWANHFGHWAGTRGRVRFNSTLAKYWTLSRRANTSDLRCAVTAERLLHGASQRRSFQIDRLRPHVAANLRRSANGVDRCDRRFDFGSERRLRGQWRRITSAGSFSWRWDL